MKKHLLATEEIADIIDYHVEKKGINDKWVKYSIPSKNPFIPTAYYFYNEVKHAVVIATPLTVVAITDKVNNQPVQGHVYHDARSYIRNKIEDKDISITGVLIGKGTSERHYIAFHEYENKMAIFDSKISNMDRFLSSANSPTFLEKLWGFFVLPMKTIANVLGFRKEIKAYFNEMEVDVYRLGTQAMMDGISCGYHSAGNVLGILDEITKNNLSNAHCRSNKVDIKTYMLSTPSKELDKYAEKLLNEKKPSPPVKHIQSISAGLSTLCVSANDSPHKQSTTPDSVLKISPVENTIAKTDVLFDQEPQENQMRSGYF